MAFLAPVVAMAAGPLVSGIGTSSLAAFSAMSSMGSFLPIALSLGGTGIQAMGQMGEAQTMAQLYSYNAQVSRMQGKAAEQQQKIRTLQKSEEQRQMAGRQIAGFAGAGVDTGTGTPLDVMADTYENYERDIQYGSYTGEVAAREGASAGAAYNWLARRQAQAGDISAMTTVLGGVGRALPLS